MITCVIIDDEDLGRMNLRENITSNFGDVAILGEAKSVSEGISIMDALKPQLVFLDIHMPDGLGFEVLRRSRHTNFEVIFVTAFDRYGLDAIKFSAIDYVVKPINLEHLNSAITKAQEQIALKSENHRLKNLLLNLNPENKTQRIAIPFSDSIEFVDVKDIIRLEADGSYTKIIIQNRPELLASGSLKEFDEKLASNGFIRTHQAHLVNTTYIKSLVKSDGGYLKLTNHDSVPISRLRKQEVLQLLR